MADESNKDSKESGSMMDKIIMGAIIGTAIGSAVGASMAPKPGKETREIIGKEAKGLWGKLKGLVTGKKPAKKEEARAHSDKIMKEIPIETDAFHE